MSEEKFELNLPDLEEVDLTSSAAFVDKQPAVGAEEAKTLSKSDSKLDDPVFRLLADPVLPRMRKKDRAKLQLQSPHRIHFYWSIKANPFETLRKSIDDRFGSYALVVRLTNLSTGEEELHRVEPKGDWWFDARPNSRYQADIGFYSPNRPFIRILFSNELTTPRKSPSPRSDYTTGFSTNSEEFSRTLDAAGYRKDAFDVALAGDEPATARSATETVMAELSGSSFDLSDELASEIRFALLALSSGHSIDELKGRVSDYVLDLISKHIDVADKERILSALGTGFDLVLENIEEFEEVGEAVFGLSVVNFPKKFRSRQVPRSLVPKLSEYINQEASSS